MYYLVTIEGSNTGMYFLTYENIINSYDIFFNSVPDTIKSINLIITTYDNDIELYKEMLTISR